MAPVDGTRVVIERAEAEGRRRHRSGRDSSCLARREAPCRLTEAVNPNTNELEVGVSFDSQSSSLWLFDCSLRTFSLKVARHERASGSRERDEGESNGGVDGTRTRGLCRDRAAF